MPCFSLPLLFSIIALRKGKGALSGKAIYSSKLGPLPAEIFLAFTLETSHFVIHWLKFDQFLLLTLL